MNEAFRSNLKSRLICVSWFIKRAQTVKDHRIREFCLQQAADEIFLCKRAVWNGKTKTGRGIK